MIDEIYGRLVDVKFIKHTVEKKRTSYYDYEPEAEQDQSEPLRWVAVYNKKKDKYIVTDSIINNGLNGEASHLNMIGFADNLDSVMFLIYEHQIAQGKKFTILDEIKMIKKERIVRVNNGEWNWNAAKIETKKKYIALHKYEDLEYYEEESDLY